MPTLRMSIRSSLEHVTKGWFNMEETSFEVYQGSKLKKLMELIKFAMQVRMCLAMFVITHQLISEYSQIPFMALVMTYDKKGDHFTLNDSFRISKLHVPPFKGTRRLKFCPQLIGTCTTVLLLI